MSEVDTSANNGGGMPEGGDAGQQQQQQMAGDEGSEVFKVYVKGPGLGSTVDKAAIEQAFQRYGEVKNVWTARDRGFCFVQMARKEDAEAAAQAMNGQEIGGVRVTAEIARRTTPGGRREFGGGYGGGGGGGAGGELNGSKPGDWVCPECNINNFARRDRCFRCNRAKPYGGGGGGGFDDRRRQRGRSRDRDYRRGYDDRRDTGYDDRRAPEQYEERRAYDDRRAQYDDRRTGGAAYEERRYDERRAAPAYDDRRGGAARPYDDRATRGRSKSR